MPMNALVIAVEHILLKSSELLINFTIRIKIVDVHRIIILIALKSYNSKLLSLQL